MRGGGAVGLDHIDRHCDYRCKEKERKLGHSRLLSSVNRLYKLPKSKASQNDIIKNKEKNNKPSEMENTTLALNYLCLPGPVLFKHIILMRQQPRVKGKAVSRLNCSQLHPSFTVRKGFLYTPVTPVAQACLK